MAVLGIEIPDLGEPLTVVLGLSELATDPVVSAEYRQVTPLPAQVWPIAPEDVAAGVFTLGVELIGEIGQTFRLLGVIYDETGPAEAPAGNYVAEPPPRPPGLGPVLVPEVQARLGNGPAATAEKCAQAIAIAAAHIGPLLQPAWRDPEDWPADLHDGIVIASVLTFRNMEAPQAVPAAYSLDGAPQVVPITWDARIRQRIFSYLNPGGLVG